MTQYGTLRAWAFIATLVGVFGMIAAAIGAIVWAFEVEGFWQTIGVLLLGLPVSIFIATIPLPVHNAYTRSPAKSTAPVLFEFGLSVAKGLVAIS